MISIIVPYWNSEPWLGRCCESLHKQSGDFEFILVNDSSTDNGPEIAKAYTEKDPRFLAINNQYGKGVSGARNTGIDYAIGEWATFLDADDELLDEAATAFSEVLKTEANIHQLNHMRYYTAIDRLVLKYANDGGTYTAENLPDCWWGVWNKLFKTEFIKSKRFDERLNYGEDGLFMLECLAEDGTIRHAPKRTVAVKHRFDNRSSLSHIKTPKDIQKQIKAYEKFLSRQSAKAMKRVTCRELGLLWERLAKEYEEK